MSDLKCAGMQLEGARRDHVTLEEATPRVSDESFGPDGDVGARDQMSDAVPCGSRRARYPGSPQ